MENASRALLMAASILVGVLMLSLVVYLYTIFGDFGSQITARIKQKETDEFNVQFTKYESYKDENGNWQNTCLASDIITIANLAKDNNNNYDFGTDSLIEKEKAGTLYITVNTMAINGKTNFETLSSEDYTNFLKQYTGEEVMQEVMQDDGTKKYVLNYVLKKYICEISIDDSSRRVKKVVLKPAP